MCLRFFTAVTVNATTTAGAIAFYDIVSIIRFQFIILFPLSLNFQFTIFSFISFVRSFIVVVSDDSDDDDDVYIYFTLFLIDLQSRCDSSDTFSKIIIKIALCGVFTV